MLSRDTARGHVAVPFWGFILVCLAPITIMGIGCSQGDKAPEVVWSRSYDGKGWDYAQDIAVDAAGNVCVAGYSVYAVNNRANIDWLIIKYDPEGKVVWTRSYDGGDSDLAFGIAADSSGNIYVTGSTKEGSNTDYLTIKYDAVGNIVWTKTHDEGEFDRARAVGVSESGNVCVTGAYRRGEHHDCLTVKYDAQGNTIWHRRYGGDDIGWRFGIAVDNSDFIYVAGPWRNPSSKDFLVIKYDPAGNIVWTRTFERTLDTPSNIPDKDADRATFDSIPSLYPGDSGNKKRFHDTARDIAVDSSGNFCVTGDSYGDFFTVKCDSGGNVIWSRVFDGGSSEEAYAVAFDAAGNVYVAGSSRDDSNSDWLMIKYDSEGNLIWTKSFGGKIVGRFDEPRGIAVDPAGNVLVTGVSENADAENADEPPDDDIPELYEGSGPAKKCPKELYYLTVKYRQFPDN